MWLNGVGDAGERLEVESIAFYVVLILASAATLWFMYSVQTHRIELETHWGGLGSGGGGWRASNSLVAVLAALALWLVFGAVTVSTANAQRDEKEKAADRAFKLAMADAGAQKAPADTASAALPAASSSTAVPSAAPAPSSPRDR